LPYKEYAGTAVNCGYWTETVAGCAALISLTSLTKGFTKLAT
jgi:hypothetical protein